MGGDAFAMHLSTRLHLAPADDGVSRVIGRLYLDERMRVDDLEIGHDTFDRDVLIGLVMRPQSMMGRGHGSTQRECDQSYGSYRSTHSQRSPKSSGPIGNAISLPSSAERSIAMVNSRLRCPSAAEA